MPTENSKILSEESFDFEAEKAKQDIQARAKFLDELTQKIYIRIFIFFLFLCILVIFAVTVYDVQTGKGKDSLWVEATKFVVSVGLGIFVGNKLKD